MPRLGHNLSRCRQISSFYCRSRKAADSPAIAYFLGSMSQLMAERSEPQGSYDLMATGEIDWINILI
jgi:hypothetical protein